MTGTKLSPDTTSKPLVLVVDDELGPRESISYALSERFGVDTADRAKAALEMIREKEYSVIVLDVRMPDMDGMTALKELRKIDPDASVIMLTGFGTLQSAQESMLAGANQFLRKPPDVGELIEAVRRQAQSARLRRQQTRMNREMRQLNRMLKKELAETEPQVWQARTSAELVHDLTNPLLVLMGYASLVEEEAGELSVLDAQKSRRLAEHARMVARAAEYARHLADNWRQITRGTVEFAAVDLTALVKEAHSLLFFDRHDLRGEGGAGMVVRGARFELLRVLQNLIKNGFEAGATSVEVRIAREDKFIVMSVIDNGEGMSAEAVDSALSGHYTSKTEGSGLGLQICRHLIGVHGGRLKIESTPGVGTVFQLSLPSFVEERGGGRVKAPPGGGAVR